MNNAQTEEQKAEEELVQWLKQFKNRRQLEKQYNRIYCGLLLNYRYILDRYLPHTKVPHIEKFKIISTFILDKGRLPKNNQNEKLLYKYLKVLLVNGFREQLILSFPNLIKETRPQITKETMIDILNVKYMNNVSRIMLTHTERKFLVRKTYYLENKTKYPIWFQDNDNISKKNKSLERLLKLLPPGLSIKPSQKWIGAKHKYVFICEKYGEFITSAEILMRKNGPLCKKVCGCVQCGRDRTNNANSIRLKGRQLKRDKKGRILSKITKEKLKSKQS